MSTSLVLRNSKADGTSKNGFQWPKSGPVECMDWNPSAQCGGGLHGLLWGEGNWSLLSSANDALWQVVEVVTESIVKIDAQKVKFPRGTVIFSGDMAGAITMVLNNEQHFRDMIAEIKAKSVKGDTSSGNDSTAASSGDASKAASSGDCSKAASSGDASTAASSGNYSTAASSGDASKAASSGNYSTAASSGNDSMAASSGDASKAASSGNCSTASATGKDTVAMAAGTNCTVQAGENGCFSTPYFDEKAKRNRILVGYVGEDGIKPNTPYRVKVMKTKAVWEVAK